jgi:D-beta-D-heptose 7-phosphate kinase/D-beta-D-heptose 1-phosphate adenosyltransferase
LLIFSQIEPKTFVIVGDLILDHYIEGYVKRISPEAPVPVLTQKSERDVLGGAGNVANNILALGGRAHLIGALGDDAAGRRFIELSQESGISISPIIDLDRKTSKKTRLVGGQQQLLRVDNETLEEIDQNIEDQIIQSVIQTGQDASAIIVSDYKKGLLTKRVMHELIEFAKSKSISVFVDPKGADYAIYHGADYIKPNRGELELLTGSKCANFEEIQQAVQILSNNTGANILVTLSQEGMILFLRDGNQYALPTVAREVYDVSGAGDTAIAAFAFAISLNSTPEQAAKFSNIASGIAVSKLGTAAVSLDEIMDQARKAQVIHDTSFEKQFSLSAATKHAENWKRQGKRIGFTNGCFDLLHPGHVALLREAAAECDRLIVGLNSDSSVRRLKGVQRPIQNELARAEVLNALQDVDHVVIFDEDTPLETIKALNPDILIKGADYEEKDIVGAEFVKAQGGRVARVKIREGHSTTNLVKRSTLN